MQLIQKHGSLEAVMSQLDTAKYGIPDPFPFQEARTLFKGALIFSTVLCRCFAVQKLRLLATSVLTEQQGVHAKVSTCWSSCVVQLPGRTQYLLYSHIIVRSN